MNKILILMNKAIAHYPELRVGQLMNCAAHIGGWKNEDLFYCPNEIIEEGLLSMIENAEREGK